MLSAAARSRINDLLGCSPREAIRKSPFREWEEHILYCVKEPGLHKADSLLLRNERLTEEDIRRYRKGDYRRVYAAARAHAQRHAREVVAPRVAVAVHPLWLSLTDGELLQGLAQQRSEIEYLGRLEALLRGRDPSKTGIVLCETAHHYAAATHRLLEQGLADQVLFTEFGKGKLMEPDSLGILDGKKSYVCGGYNGKCLFSVARDILLAPGNTNGVNAIANLVLESPEDTIGPLLNPSSIYPFPESWTMMLDESLSPVPRTPSSQARPE